MWVGRRPDREENGGTALVTGSGRRRPVVAVLDTGVGTHPWFGDYDPSDPTHGDGNGVVLRQAKLDDGPIGTFPLASRPAEDAEFGGASSAPLTGPLDPIAGHGTFIAGIVHQVAPDAAILPVRIFGGSGTVPEWDVLQSLRRLLRFHLRGLRGVAETFPVDVVVLSMGYYHERPEDLDYDGPLREVIRALRRSGVVVVVAAGNDGSTRPMYPAAFAPRVDRGRERSQAQEGEILSRFFVPLLAVGARNPDGSTALFSNEGPWVTCLKQGAAVVSTIPTTLNGPTTPSLQLPDEISGGYRATIDPENFRGGFATWSGTSFAAPVLAAEVARAIFRASSRAADAGRGPGHGSGVSSDGDILREEVETRVDRAWHAVTALVGIDRPAEPEGD